jgi:hypothetical protein
LEYRNSRLEFRTTPIYTCWRTERPTLVRQSTTIQLNQDALKDEPVLFLSTRAERLRIRYSVLVSQYVESAEEFAYNEVLRKNTEAVGTINDPLPSQLTGNVHRVGSPTEPVLGFVGAHTLQYQRLFIDRQELPLPSNWQFDSPYDNCLLADEYFFDPLTHLKVLSWPHTIVFATPGNVPVGFDIIGRDTIGYIGGKATCVDCRLRGSNIKPSFW